MKGCPRLAGQALRINFRRSIFTSESNVIDGSGPLVTGNGPFVDVPTLEPLGNLGGFVKVELPQGSVLNVQLTSVSVIKGNSRKLNGTLALKCGDMWCQEIRLDAPCTLLLSNNEFSLPNQTYVDVKKPYKWMLPDSKDLLAWSGLHLSLAKQSLALSVEGNGFFIARGCGNIQEYLLNSEELILVQEKALVATSGEIDYTPLAGVTFLRGLSIFTGTSHYWSRGISFLHRLSTRVMPQLWLSSSLKAISDVKNSFNIEWISNSLPTVGYRRRNQIGYISIRGPGQVLVQTNPQS